MSKEFTNLEDLFAFLQKEANKTLKQEVTPKVVKSLQENVENMVYSYDPKQYTRTGTLKESFQVNESSDGVEITNTMRDDGRDVGTIVETGIGYTYSGYGYDYEKPRPFMGEEEEKLKNGEFKRLMKIYLNANGINAE